MIENTVTIKLEDYNDLRDNHSKAVRVSEQLRTRVGELEEELHALIKPVYMQLLDSKDVEILDDGTLKFKYTWAKGEYYDKLKELGLIKYESALISEILYNRESEDTADINSNTKESIMADSVEEGF